MKTEHNTPEQDLQAMDAVTAGAPGYDVMPDDLQSGLRSIAAAATALLPSASAQDKLVIAAIAHTAYRLLEALKAGERRYFVG